MPVHHKKGLVEPLFGAIDWAAVDWKKKNNKIFYVVIVTQLYM